MIIVVIESVVSGSRWEVEYQAGTAAGCLLDIVRRRSVGSSHYTTPTHSVENHFHKITYLVLTFSSRIYF